MLVSTSVPLAAKSRKGDKYIVEGRKAEQLKQWDRALDCYEKALAEDPGNVSYTLAMRRVRFQAAQSHVELGQRLREQGKVDEALMEFQRAYAIDLTSSIAIQEIRRTKAMLDREKQGEKSKAGERGMTAIEHERKAIEERIASERGAPELKPISRQPITLRMNNQPPRVVFETVGKLAGINVILDPEFAQMGPPRNVNVELNNTTLEEALDYVAILTKCYWKPLSSNTIVVAQDNVTKRRDYDDHVVKVFYVANATTTQELNEIASAVRGITDIRRVFVYNAQNAIMVRGEVDKVALAEKLVHDLDKPKAEVVIDVLVMQTSRSHTRNLAAALTSGGSAGLDVPITFTPRNPTVVGTSGTSGTSTTTTSTSSLMSLAGLGKLSTNDFSLTMPGAMLQLIMSDSATRILQSPQLRSADGQKASLKIGDKTPIATGGIQPYGMGVGGTTSGYGGLYQNFQFIDVGVNVDITPKIHGTDEVSLHVELDISSVKDRIDLGGISQPVIGQSKVAHDIRIREGEVNILGGLTQMQRSKSNAGIPGVSSIPILRRLFTSESNTDSDSELLIALIPHIIRSQDITESNLKEVATGTETVYRLSYAPKRPPEAAPAPAPVIPTEKLLQAPPATQPAAPAGPPKLTFAPAAVEAQAGTEITVRLDMANAADLFASPLRIKFDPKILRLNEVSSGNLMGDTRQVIFTRNIRNDAGEASINLNRLPGSGGIHGSGALLILNFQTVGRGTTKIAVAEINAKDSKMQPLAVTAPEAVVNIK